MKPTLADRTRGAELSAFVRSFHLPGGLSLVHRREPDYFDGLSVQGKVNQVVVANDENGSISSMGVRSLKPVFVNGNIQTIGYLHGLKTRAANRNRGEAAKGYLFVKKLHRDGATPAYLNTVLDENTGIHKMFSRKRHFLPNNIPLGTYVSYSIPIRRGCMQSDSLPFSMVRGTELSFEQVIAFWRKWGKEKQFFPVYNESDFSGTYCRDFYRENLLVAMQNGEVIGTLGLWNQNGYKQTIVNAYNGWWTAGRPLYNLMLSCFNYPQLPPVGSTLKMVYGAFMCIKDNNPEILRRLIRLAHKPLISIGADYLIIGLHEKDRLKTALKWLFSIKYKSRLYVTGWDELQPFLESLDSSKIPYLEVATL